MPLVARPAGRLLAALLFFLPYSAAPALAGQATRDARVIITVVDPTGGIIPDATVSLIGLEDATRGALAPVKTNDKGIATIERVTPGRYSIQAQFPAFDLGLVRDIRINTGENRRVVVLPLKGLQESVSVGGGQEGASTRGTSAFGLSLTTDQIASLSDDPSELQRQIGELAGADAVIRVDSFEGQQLPPKSQIKSIHVTRDQFAAETEQPGATFVDVITQAGVGPIRGSANFSFRDGSMNGANPFVAPGTKTPEQVRGYGFSIGGAIIPERADFSISVNGSNTFSNPILNANKVTGAPSEVMDDRSTFDFQFINGIFNYALSRDQTLRINYTQQNNSNVTGFGGYDSIERMATYDYNSYGIRVMEAGPIGRRVFINTRLGLFWTDQTRQSAVEAPTVYVLDSMRTGGAQVAGGTHDRSFSLESDVDYVRGIHSWRAGVKVTGGSFRTDERSNYLGTYTFSSPEDYYANRPSTYMIETGNPVFGYTNVQSAVYIQDDIRVSKSLTLSPGVRYSAQSRISDPLAFEPRFGMTWAPFASGKTTLRASAGNFHGWLSTGVLAQSIRLDGTHQRQFIVRNPSYPDPGTDGTVPPVSRYLIGNYQLNQNVRYSAGVDQVLTPQLRLSIIYSYWHMKQLPRGEQLNPLVDGVRVDPSFDNVIATVTDAEIRRHDLYTTFNWNFAAGRPTAQQGFFNWRRLVLNGGYSFLNPKRSGIGPWDVPPSGTLATEWGRGPANQRYVVNTAITSTQFRNWTVLVNINIADGFVYHQTTGTDDNGDGFFNDRPEGVGIWNLRTDGRETVNARIAYNFNLGGAAAPGQLARYRASAYVQIANVSNHANYAGYSGVMTSRDYRQPTAVINPRQITMGMSLNF